MKINHRGHRVCGENNISVKYQVSSAKYQVSSVKGQSQEEFMQETGRVVEILGNMAKVELAEKEVCHKCPSESFCKLTTGGSRTIDALNEMGAKVGDTVKIEISSKNILVSAFFVYIYPILVLLFAGALTQLISGSQNLAIIIGLTALAVSFLVVRFVNRKMSRAKKLIPVIKEIKN